jgi:uncharacterized damage-inducible protein DinB
MSSILDELFRFNAWANGRVLDLAENLTDQQLDERRELGQGTLRNTMFHLLTAEEIWLERWQGKPRRLFPVDAEGMAIAAMRDRLALVDEQRKRLIESVGEEGLAQTCHYQDVRGNHWANPLHELMLHVANHGVHHRAQALHFLKHCGHKAPGGLDYVFFRLAWPEARQEKAVEDLLRGYSLEMATGTGQPIAWERDTIEAWFNYGDWANRKLAGLIAGLDESAVARDFGMGLGNIGRTAKHILEAEQFWLNNWQQGSGTWQELPDEVTVFQLPELWQPVIEARNRMIIRLDDAGAQRRVGASFGGPPVMVSLLESLLQLCGHGTHHRAQLLNMLRHSGLATPAIDYVVFARERQAASFGSV